jgi:hypothetical protein
MTFNGSNVRLGTLSLLSVWNWLIVAHSLPGLTPAP